MEISPCFETRLGKLYYGDCIQHMKSFPVEFIDLIVTSPPYNINLDYDEDVSDNMTKDEYLEFTNEYLSGCYRILKDDGRICLNIGCRAVNNNVSGFDYVDVLNVIRDVGFDIRDTIIWIKSKNSDNPQAFSSGSNTAWGSWMSPSNPACRSRMEFIFVLTKKYRKKNNKGISDITRDEFLDCASNVWFFPAEMRKVKHKAPFPEEFPKRCIKFYSWVGDLVFDPFMGSGTTAVACERHNRKWIGSELSKKYCEMASLRIEQVRRDILVYGE